jgi:predicted ATPase
MESAIRPDHGDSDVREMASLLSHCRAFHFHDTSRQSPLRSHASQVESDYLRSEGRNLGAYLLSLSSSSSEVDRAAFDRILRLTQQIAPFIKTLDPAFVDPRNPGTSAVRLDWTDARDFRFGVDQLSDGTLRAIALITALAQPVDRLPSFICIDEPELGLHPAALKLFVGLVRSVAPRCQVVIATQSLALLDDFEPSEIVVVESVAGASTFTPLPLDKLAAWLDDYSLSELYVRNLFGGRP